MHEVRQFETVKIRDRSGGNAVLIRKSLTVPVDTRARSQRKRN